MSADPRGLVHVRKRLRRSRKFTQQTLMRVRERSGHCSAEHRSVPVQVILNPSPDGFVHLEI
jgi:hypothetical protein